MSLLMSLRGAKGDGAIYCGKAGLPRSLRSLAMTTALSILLSACSLAPDFIRPEIETPKTFKETDGWLMATPADALPRGKWWEIFKDETLNGLEEKAGLGNQDLKIALARYEQARAGVRAARADFFPTITAGAHDLRERSSPNFSSITTGKPFNDYTLQGDLSYEIDLWGRIRNQVQAAKDISKASGADVVAVELSLRAELAANYFSLRGDDAAQAALDVTVEAYSKALDLTRDRFKGGVAAQADVDQAEAQYQGTKTQALELHLKRAQLEHAIAVLTGTPPESFSLAATPLTDITPPAIWPGMPSTLLERRPDIAAAERRASAANAEIGVARAAWFPDFSITGLLGLQSASSGNWMSAGSRIWSLGPQAVVTLFDAGRINALSDQARAAYDEQAATYRKTVLNAYAETEDSIVALRQLELEGKSQTAALDAAERSLRQSQDRYTGGIVTYLDVVVAQNTALQARLSWIDIETRRMTATVQLIKALGGGWDDAPKTTQPVDLIGPVQPPLVPKVPN